MLPEIVVVAAIIRDRDNRLCLSRRPEHKHQGGLWEFPGGKVEEGEPLERALARELDEELGMKAARSQPFMTVRHRYPDLRVPLELIDIADLMDGVEFKVFAGPAKDPKGRVVAMKVPGGGDLSRKEIDEYTKFVGIYGAKGLAYIKANDLDAGRGGLQAPVPKVHPEEGFDFMI